MRNASRPVRSRWPIVCLAVVLWLVCLPGGASAAGPTTVSMSEPSKPLEAGEQFSVSIDLVPDTGIAGMQFDLSFDPSFFSVSMVQQGDLLSQGGATAFFSPGTVDNETGRVTGVFGAITTPGMAVSAPGTFATITFTTKTQSQGCPLSLSNVIVGDIAGNAVPISLDNHGAPSGAIGKPVLRWWLPITIVAVAALPIAAIGVGTLLLKLRSSPRGSLR